MTSHAHLFCSGCFGGLTGKAVGGDNPQGFFTYDFDVTYDPPNTGETDTEIPTTSPTGFPTLAPRGTQTGVPTTDETSRPSPTASDVCGRLDRQVEEEQDDVALDLGIDGYSTGDSYLFDSNTLTTAEYTDGFSAGRCVVLEGTEDNNLYCSMVFEFEEGVVALQGVFSDIDVIGGSGCYESTTAEVSLGPSSIGFTYTFNPVTSPPDNCPSDLLDSSPWIEEGGYADIDWEDNGVSSGDLIVFDSQQITTASGLQGFLEGECVILESLDKNKAFCAVTFIFDSSRLYAMGEFDAMTITGGTGCFLGVSGKIAGQRGITTGQFALTLDEEDSNQQDSCSTGVFENTWVEELGETLIDYDGLNESPGDLFAFSDKSVAIPTTSGNISGTSAGRCFFLQDLSSTYCTISLTTSEGSIILQGFYGNLIIVGGSGCYRGLSGTVTGGENEDGFTYDFDIE